ncbi:hypothetical protein T492DRAFT_839508 [Pavlovales sp. CCMP2436]|nr:hypothetical protein T492DRAFT_839508 [Pavlovales sp. CCMP2436]
MLTARLHATAVAVAARRGEKHTASVRARAAAEGVLEALARAHALPHAFRALQRGAGGNWEASQQAWGGGAGPGAPLAPLSSAAVAAAAAAAAAGEARGGGGDAERVVGRAAAAAAGGGGSERAPTSPPARAPRRWWRRSAVRGLQAGGALAAHTPLGGCRQSLRTGLADSQPNGREGVLGASTAGLGSRRSPLTGRREGADVHGGKEGGGRQPAGRRGQAEKARKPVRAVDLLVEAEALAWRERTCLAVRVRVRAAVLRVVVVSSVEEGVGGGGKAGEEEAAGGERSTGSRRATALAGRAVEYSMDLELGVNSPYSAANVSGSSLSFALAQALDPAPAPAPAPSPSP